jgi:small acid-soluble spore protein D (minor alpha/beta-type SASP)
VNDVAGNNNNGLLVPQARVALADLKVEVAQELGLRVSNGQDLQQTIDQRKYEIAQQIGVPLQPGYNGDVTSREAGAVGGRLGGHLGGQMVKRMIAQAEQALAARQR